MPEQTFQSQFFVKINGTDVPSEFMDDVIEIVVDSSLYLPEMFTILLQDDELKWVDDESLLALGKPVEISAKAGDQLGGKEGLLMKGEIAALEPTFSGQGRTMLLVRGYNKSHRLHRGKQTRTFLKQSDSDIVRKIAGEVGLAAQVDATSPRYDYVIQNNQTNMEFLQERAERIGYKVFAAEGTLYFKLGDTTLGSGPELIFGKTLINFQPVMSATHQTDKVRVMGWDVKTKQPIQNEQLPKLKQGGIPQTGGVAAKKAFGAAESITVNQPLTNASEATNVAKGLAYDVGSEFIQSEGSCYGHPGIKPGYDIIIKGIGKRFSGKYFVTTATHIWNEQGYETQFTISGRKPNTVSRLLESNNGHVPGQHHMPGVVIGLVTNLNDPENMGRVKVKYPWLGNNIESDWIRIAAPGAGMQRGLMVLPEVNDEVLIAFEHGNVHWPYVIGGLWNGKDKPPVLNNQAVGGGKVNQRMFKTRSGHILLFDDSQGKEQISITTKAQHLLLMDDSEGQEKIVIRDKSNQNEMVIDSAKKSVSINATQDMTLKCGNKLTLDCTELVINAKANGSIKANSNLTLQGTGKSELKGSQVSVNGTAQTEVKGSAMVQIQGAMVKIN